MPEYAAWFIPVVIGMVKSFFDRGAVIRNAFVRQEQKGQGYDANQSSDIDAVRELRHILDRYGQFQLPKLPN